MNYDVINSLVAKGLSTRKISTELKTSQSNVRYWLKKFNIKTTSRSKVSDYRHCPRCETEKLKTEFYNRRNGKGNSVYCKSCSHAQTLERQKDFKVKIEADSNSDLKYIVVIPCYFEFDVIRTLNSIWNSIRPKLSIEVILVINSSLLEKKFFPVFQIP